MYCLHSCLHPFPSFCYLSARCNGAECRHPSRRAGKFWHGSAILNKLTFDAFFPSGGFGLPKNTGNALVCSCPGEKWLRVQYGVN